MKTRTASIVAAVVVAALGLAARPEFAGGRLVTVICDSGDRYMSLPFFAP